MATINILIMGRGGAINAERVVAIAPAKSAPVRRLLEAAGRGRVIDMTYGYPRQAIILFDNGYIAIVSRTVEELARALAGMTEDGHADPPWW